MNYKKKADNSVLTTENSNLFVNKYLNNRNHQHNDIFGSKQTSSSTLSNSGRLNKKNLSSMQLKDETVYNKAQAKDQPHHMRSQLDFCVTESKQRSTRGSNFGDENEVTFGKPVGKQQNRNASMNEGNVEYNKLICNNCLNTQLSTVRRLKGKENEDINYIEKQEENNRFVVRKIINCRTV